MSQISRAISEASFGLIAISLTLGAVQFASGHDLTGGLAAGLTTGLTTGPATSPATSPATGVATVSAPPEEDAVNRAAKADRLAAVAASSVPTRTISIQVGGLADTSVVIRLPSAAQSRSVPRAPLPAKPGERKLTIACEPVVSALTEAAKLLQPGRCVT